MQFSGDFAIDRSLSPDNTKIKEVWLLSHNVHVGNLQLPGSQHSGYLIVTTNNDVILARGGPTEEPPDNQLVSVFFQEVAHRILRATHVDSLGSRARGLVEGMTRHFGDMLPTVHRLREKPEGSESTGPDTKLFTSIAQGKGIEGLVAQPFTRLALIADASRNIRGDDGKPVSVQHIYNGVFEYARATAEAAPPYNLIPTPTEPGVNCHSFTYAAAHVANIASIVDPLLGFALGKRRLAERAGAIDFNAPVEPLTGNNKAPRQMEVVRAPR